MDVYIFRKTRYTESTEFDERMAAKKVKNRLHGIDAVRTAAILFVVILHSISLSECIENAASPMWVLALYLRQLSFACVPLFLMLSGYLQNRKKFCAAYYRGIIPLYLSYIVISILCVAAYAIYGYKTDAVSGFGGAVYSLLNFSANPYAWYFEMYIGLFLLIPFLNMIYHGIHTRRGKHILLLSLILLTVLPDTAAGLSPYYSGASDVTWDIFPDFFKSLYPVTYYFMGCYIAEFQPKLRGGKKLLALCAPLLPCGMVLLYTHLRGQYAWYVCNGFQTLTSCITALAVFLALYDVDIKGRFLQKLLEQIALCSFEMYLLSYLWDNLIYNVIELHLRLPLAFTVILVFLCSFGSAIVLRLCLQPIAKVLMKGYNRLTCGKVEDL